MGANTANLLLELLFVYTLDLGLAGSAWGTVIAQVAAASAYLAVVARAVRREGASVRPTPTASGRMRPSGRLVVRTGALLVTLLTATAIASRFGDDDVAAQQVAMQVFLLLRARPRALAIAAQAMVGRFLGAAARRDARAVARRGGARRAGRLRRGRAGRATPVAGIAVHQ